MLIKKLNNTYIYFLNVLVTRKSKSQVCVFLFWYFTWFDVIMNFQKCLCKSTIHYLFK